jgi:C1A family cysteine protease
VPSFGVLGPDPDKNLFSLYRSTVTPHQALTNVSYEYLFGPVEDQGNFGSCVAFATSALSEAIIYKRTHTRVEMSEAAIYSLTKHNFESTLLNDEGLYVGDALKVLELIGYVPAAAFPYRDDAATCLAAVPQSLIKTDHELKGFERVGGNETDPATLVQAMQHALIQKGPIAIGIDFQQDWFNPDPQGYLTAKPVQGTAGGHEMVIVGYSTNKQAFRIRNSWSANWGDNGYCWLPFSSSVLPSDAYTIAI